MQLTNFIHCMFAAAARYRLPASKAPLFLLVSAPVGYALYRLFRKSPFERECKRLLEYHDRDVEDGALPRPRSHIARALDVVRMDVGRLPDSKANRLVVNRALRVYFKELCSETDLRLRDAERMVLEAEFFFFLKTPGELFIDELARTQYARGRKRVGSRP
jgi:hypothetical protein